MARAKRTLNRSPLFVKFTSKVVTEDLCSLRRDASLQRDHSAQFQTSKGFGLPIDVAQYRSVGSTGTCVIIYFALRPPIFLKDRASAENSDSFAWLASGPDFRINKQFKHNSNEIR
jgi:hypothetical protein